MKKFEYNFLFQQNASSVGIYVTVALLGSLRVIRLFGHIFFVFVSVDRGTCSRFGFVTAWRGGRHDISPRRTRTTISRNARSAPVPHLSKAAHAKASATARHAPSARNSARVVDSLAHVHGSFVLENARTVRERPRTNASADDDD